MKGFFITGTDTNVGKTIVSAVLTMILQGRYWKPIQSGDDSDVEKVQHLTAKPKEFFIPPLYSMKASLAPDQAAKLEGIEIDLDQFVLPKSEGPLIVEGAGGVLVPLNQQKKIIDLIDQLKLPVIIVTRGTLGTINHTLLTINALRQRNISIHGIIFNGELNPDNQKSIEYWGQVKTLLHVPFFNPINHATLLKWIKEQSYFLEGAI